MAIVLVGTGVSGVANNGNDVTLSLPVMDPGTRVVVVGVHGRRTGSSYGPSTGGYTQHHLRADPGTTGHPVAGCWSKVMGDTPDTQVVCVGSGNTSDAAFYAAYALTGVDATTPIDVTVQEAASVDPPALSGLTAGALVITLAAASVNDSAVTVPSGYSNFLKGNQTETNPISGATSTKEIVGGGSEDPTSYSDLTATNPYSFSIAFRPASGASTITVTGSLTLPAMTAAGSVAAKIDVSGALPIPAMSAAGSVTARVDVTGSLTLPAFTATGSVEDRVNVTGSLVLPAFTAAGDVSTETGTSVTVTGSLVLPAFTAAGSAINKVEVSGSLTVPAFTASGTVAARVDVSGALTIPAMVSAGDITTRINATGSLVLPVMVAAGDVNTTDARTVTGALVLPAMTAAGSVQTKIEVVGALTLPSLTAGGTVAASVGVSGDLVLPVVVATGEAAVPVLVTGQLVLPGFLMTGTISNVGQQDVEITFDEHLRVIEFSEPWRRVYFDEYQREIEMEGDEMDLNRRSREFYDPRPSAAPAAAPSDWHASFDEGISYQPAQVVDGLPKWLVYGPLGVQGSAVAQVSDTMFPLIKLVSNPEEVVVRGPRIRVVG